MALRLVLLHLAIASVLCKDILDDILIVDGHNDVPMNTRRLLHNNLNSFPFEDLLSDQTWAKDIYSYTDLKRLRAGQVGAQFWSVYVSCSKQYKDAVAASFEQLDVIKRMVKKFDDDMQLVTDANGILEAFANGKIASLIGVEGGHSIDSRLGVLRMMYELGARYMTLTHTCNTPWADGSPSDNTGYVGPKHNLTLFGEKIVKEMNRLGMMVDLSHVSHGVMLDALHVSKAPVIFSHSGSREMFNHTRNVADDVLIQLKINGGLLMLTFYINHLGNEGKVSTAVGEELRQELFQLIYSHSFLIDHINHVVDLIGVDHVGIGADFDGFEKTDGLVEGLEDVSTYPNLLKALVASNPERWTLENIRKLASDNLIRVFKDVEKVRDSLVDLAPYQDWIPDEDLEDVSEQERILISQCRT